jgi:hypothetical protein
VLPNTSKIEFFGEKPTHSVEPSFSLKLFQLNSLILKSLNFKLLNLN